MLSFTCFPSLSLSVLFSNELQFSSPLDLHSLLLASPVSYPISLLRHTLNQNYFSLHLCGMSPFQSGGGFCFVGT